MVSRHEATFRAAARDAPPWNLDAPQLTEWLTTRWVMSEPHETDPKAMERVRADRAAFVRALAGTDGFQLLTKCATDNARAMPSVKIALTKRGQKLHDEEPARQLTAFL